MTPIKSSGSAGVLPIECINPRRNTYRIRWNITEQPDGTAEWTEQDFDHRPTLDEIKSAIIASINQATEAAILTGMTYEGHPVWLSPENQRNYLAALALAQCAATASKPASTDTPSSSTDVPSSSTDTQPSCTDAQSASTDVQSSCTDTQSASTDAQSSCTDTQPASTDAQPASTDAQPADSVILPITVKLGTDQIPVYRTFVTLGSLTAFCTAVESHIQRQLRAGWAAKDAINLAPYADAHP